MNSEKHSMYIIEVETSQRNPEWEHLTVYSRNGDWVLSYMDTLENVEHEIEYWINKYNWNVNYLI